MNKEFEKLQKENEKIRGQITKLAGNDDNLWALINSLVENELKQEELCE